LVETVMVAAEYVLGDAIGRGGGGTVFRARSLSYGEVAVKKLPGGEIGSLQLTELQHPNVVPVYAQFVEDGTLHVVMPLARGTLRGRMDVLGGAMAPARAARLIGQVADGLRYLHDRGILHLDLKPANVLLGEDDRPMLSDLSPDQAAGQGIVGTPAYMAPEQCLGRAVDARADQYALALVAFELLTGRRPYAAPTIEALLEQHVAGPVPAAGIAPAVDTVLARGMAKVPAARFGSVTDFAESLAAAIAASEPTPTRLSRLRRATAAARRLLRRQPLPASPPPELETRSVEPLPVERPRAAAVGQETTATATRLVRALRARADSTAPAPTPSTAR
jgi:serine/threonine protein kinase